MRTRAWLEKWRISLAFWHSFGAICARFESSIKFAIRLIQRQFHILSLAVQRASLACSLQTAKGKSVGVLLFNSQNDFVENHYRSRFEIRGNKVNIGARKLENICFAHRRLRVVLMRCFVNASIRYVYIKQHCLFYYRNRTILKLHAKIELVFGEKKKQSRANHQRRYKIRVYETGGIVVESKLKRWVCFPDAFISIENFTRLIVQFFSIHWHPLVKKNFKNFHPGLPHFAFVSLFKFEF